MKPGDEVHNVPPSLSMNEPARNEPARVGRPIEVAQRWKDRITAKDCRGTPGSKRDRLSEVSVESSSSVARATVSK